MQLFWSSRSPYARKVMVVAHELGLAETIELVPVVVTLRTREPSVATANPLGQIPTLLTGDGATIYGSAVICEYLAAQVAASSLYPADPALRFDALTRQALGDGVLDALMRWYSERSRADDPKAAEFIAVARAKLLGAAAHLDHTAASMPFDIGAVAIASALAYADFRFAELDWRADHPNAARWFSEVTARPSFVATAHTG